MWNWREESSSALDGMQPTLQAGAAERGLAVLADEGVDAGRLQAQLRGADRRHVTAGTAADHHYVELLAHLFGSPWRLCLQAQQHAVRVFQLVLDVDQEQHRVLAVDDAVVVADSAMYIIGAIDDLAVLDDRRAP